MINNERLRIGIPYLFLIVIGCCTIVFVSIRAVRAALVVGILSAVVGSIGYLWTARTPKKPKRTFMDEGWVPVIVRTHPDTADDLKQATSEGWKITKRSDVP